MTEAIRRNLPRHVVGIMSVALSGFFIAVGRTDPVIFLASVFFLVICTTDTLKAKIPNSACALLALGAIFYHIISAGPRGFLTALLGVLTGFALFLIPYSMGGMGAGDVKALGALGALLGPAATFQVFLYTGLIGAIMAVLQIATDGHLFQKIIAWKNALLVMIGTGKYQSVIPGNTSPKLKFPYASAIAFGYFAFLFWGELIQ